MAGRKAHTPSAEQRKTVEAMSAYGIPQEDIASVIGLDSKTLRKYYSEELAVAKAKANAKVAENLFRKATGDGPQSVSAAIFWLKTRGQWRETNYHEIEATVNSSIYEWITGALETAGGTVEDQPDAVRTAGSGSDTGKVASGSPDSTMH